LSGLRRIVFISPLAQAPTGSGGASGGNIWAEMKWLSSWQIYSGGVGACPHPAAA
jgi:hypothetical protein